MSRPKGGYRTANGKRVPGTTTITGRFKDSGGLIQWAYQCGCDGIDLNEARDAAAGAGTICHDMIESHIKGATWTPPKDASADMIDGARQGFENFLTWSVGVNLEVLATEVPLVSEEFRFGGTIDAVAIASDKLVILDWKTSKGTRVYAEMLLQLAAYRHLWEVCKGERPDGAHLVRINREHGQSVHYQWDSDVLDTAWEYFKHLRAAYDLDKQLKKVVG